MTLELSRWISRAVAAVAMPTTMVIMVVVAGAKRVLRHMFLQESFWLGESRFRMFLVCSTRDGLLAKQVAIRSIAIFRHMTLST